MMVIWRKIEYKGVLTIKKAYEPPEIEITFFSVEDIMTMSGVDNSASWNTEWDS